MELSTVAMALPIFFIAYQGIGMLLEARSQRKWGPVRATRTVDTPQRAIREFANLSAKMGFNKVLLRNKALHERLDLLLLRSGYPFGWKAEDLLFCKEILAILLMVWIWRVGAHNPVLCVVTFALGFWLPDLYMKGKATARQMEIQRLLPGFIDLTALALESGLDLMAAIERIMEKMKASSLRQELGMLLQETRLGTPRKEALEHWAYRVPLPDIQAMTSMIIQSEELGTSLGSVLRNYAEDMRNRRILRAEEVAGKMPVKLLFPMMVFFFPVVFVIIFGPIAMSFLGGSN